MAQQIDVVMNVIAKVDSAENSFRGLQKTLQKFKLPANLDNDFKKSFSNLEGLFETYRKQLSGGFETKGDVSAFSKTSKAINVELDRLSKKFTELTGQEINFRFKTDEIKAAENKIKDLRKQLAELSEATKGKQVGKGQQTVNSILGRFSQLGYNTGKNADKALLELEKGNIAGVQKALADLEKSYVRVGDAKAKAFKKDTGMTMDTALVALKKALQDAGVNFDDLVKKINLTEDELLNLNAQQVENINKELVNGSNILQEQTGKWREADAAAQDYASSTYRLSDQLKDLQKSTQYFFSLRSMINLFKRGIDQAVESVRNLDAAMTETAVVTTYSVGDMWAKLPEYTANANKLGATIQDMYESTTLYYQQGLNTEQAMSIATETMKMARIAGLEAADATDMMTAALRGFNMEINEMSAQRINDVYSNLAAKTASNTEELGTAMQRTASIAHSAGMSFEGTAAFLAQAIETTREPAENLGTAMKTIVARFQEMKKNPLELVEVDGEEVSYNKVDEALQSIGVSLKDANGQFRDLDKVFLDISAKWDSLSQTQQRYIATIAAGSRQQSRFIAMMSNYGRTVELMAYANDSAGASQEQFGKTLESFEAKVNKLKNAWQQFTMGLANEKLIKGTIDILTKGLTLVNNLLSKIPGKMGVFKSIASLLLTFQGLRFGGKIANWGIGKLGNAIDPNKAVIGSNQPVVAKLSEILNAVNNIKNNGVGNNDNTGTLSTSETSLKKLRKDFYGKSYDFDQLSSYFGKLDSGDQASLFNSLLGSKSKFKESANSFYKNIIGDDKDLQKIGVNVIDQIMDGMSSGKIDPSKGFKAFSNPTFLKDLGVEGGEKVAKAFNDKVAEQFSKTDFAKENSDLIVKDLDDLDFLIEGYSEAGDSETVAKLEAARKSILESFGKSEKFEAGGFADGLGRISEGATRAGMALQTLGGSLKQLGGPFAVAGAAMESFGRVLTTVGTTIGNVVNSFISIKKGIGFLKTAGLLGPLGIALGVILAIGTGIALWKRHLNNIKNSAQEVVDKYKEVNEQTTKNIGSLKQWQSEAQRLQNGISDKGYNVGLSTEDYDQYKEIVDQLIEINPKVVKGYNAQGDAIVDLNEALSETLKLEEERKKQAVRQYTGSTSINKLIAARNLGEGYKASLGDVVSYNGMQEGYARTWSEKNGIPLETNIKKASFAKDAKKIAEQIQSSMAGAVDWEKKYGINYDDLLTGEKQAVDLFVQYQDEILADAEYFSEEYGITLNDGITKGFEKLKENSAKLEEEIQPLYQALLTRASQQAGYEDILPEFQDILQTQLKDIAISAPDAKTAIKDTRVAVQAVRDLSSEYSNLKDIEEDVAKARADYAKDLDWKKYEKSIQGQIDALENLKGQYDETTTYGRVAIEALTKKQDELRYSLENVGTSISDAFASANQAIQSANSAYDRFKESIGDTDFSTAADGMKSIWDEVMGTTKSADDRDIRLHAEGRGDKTFWAGAEAMLNQEFLKESKWDIYDVFPKMESMEKYFKPGYDGFKEFYDDIVNLSQGAKDRIGKEVWDEDTGFFTNLNDEQFKQLAIELGVSDDFLTSMLQKGRQFMQIDFGNMDKLREALAFSDSTIKGIDSLTDAKGQKRLYMTEAEIRQALAEQGYVNPEMQRSWIESHADELNFRIIPEVDGTSIIGDLDQVAAKTEDLFKNSGANGAKEFIEMLSKAGLNQEQIKKIGEQQSNEEIAKQFRDEGTYNELYSAAMAAIEDPNGVQQVTLLEDINGTLDRISAQIEAGDSWDATKYEYDKLIKEDGSIVSNFAQGLNVNGEEFADSSEYLTNRKAVTEILSHLDDEITKANEEGDFTKAAALQQYKEETQEALDKAPQAWADIIKAREEEAAAKEQEARDKYAAEAQARADTETDKSPGLWEKLIGYAKKGIQAENEGYEASAASGAAAAAQQQSDKAQAGVIKSIWDSIWSNFSEGSVQAAEAQKKATDAQIQDTSKIFSDIGDGIEEFGEAYAEQEQARLDAIQAQYDAWTGLFTLLGEKINNIISFVQEIWPFGKNKDKGKGTETEKGPTKSTSSSTTENKITNETITKTETITNIVDTQETPESKATREEIENFQESDDSEIDININGETNEELGKSIKVIDELKANAGKTIGLQIKASSNISTIQNQIANLSKNVTINVNADISDLVRKISEATRKILELKIFGRSEAGHNNKIPTTTLPTFGSMARGGTVGPKNNGGLTLTGEKGFEIAWIPSENRSMILGVGGPQMVNLPSEAVVYTHEQSKDILKRKGIPAGSHASVQAKGIPDAGPGHYSSSSSSSGSGASDKTVKNNTKTVTKSTTAVKKATNTISVFWDNISRMTEASRRAADKDSESLEKLLEKIGGKLDGSITKLTNTYKSDLKKVVDNNQRIVTYYTNQLAKLEKGGATASISYGKSKETVDLANYVNKDATGAYVIDSEKIKKMSAERGKAIVDAANTYINDRVSKVNSAQDEIDKAKEELDELSNKVYEAFYSWKKEFNEIYVLSKKLDEVQSQRDRFTSQIDLELAKLTAGFGSHTTALENIIRALDNDNKALLEQLDYRQRDITAKKQALDEALSWRDDYLIYDAAQANNAAGSQAEGDYLVAKIVSSLLQDSRLRPDGTYDLTEAYKTLNSSNYNKETYDKIKEKLDEIYDAQQEYQDAIKSATDDIKSIYDKIEEYQKTLADAEDKLLSGLEEETEAQIDRLDKLDKSLTDTLKNLLDEVKKKIDQRRKQEDNEKTENEIAQRQQRLAMLRADTAGGNAAEIARLEKELADSTRTYERSLEDQLIERLQDQADKASKQRQKQIQLLEDQKEISKSTNSYVETVDKWIKNPQDYIEDIRAAWRKSEKYDEEGEFGQAQLDHEFEVFMAGLIQADEEIQPLNLRLEELGIAVEDLTTILTTQSSELAQALEGRVTKLNTQVDDGTYSKEIALLAQGLSAAEVQAITGANYQALQKAVNMSKGTNGITQKSMAGAVVDNISPVKGTKTQGHLNYKGTVLGAVVGSTMYTADWDPITGLRASDYRSATIDKWTPNMLVGHPEEAAEGILYAIANQKPGTVINSQIKDYINTLGLAGKYIKNLLVGSAGTYGSIGDDGKFYYDWGGDVYVWDMAKGSLTKEAFNQANFIKKAKNELYGREYVQALRKKGVPGYKTGGLADYTGPAWLHGTSSKPELVLNAQDTKNFIALKDVLSGFMGNVSTMGAFDESSPIYEININVDKLTSDYDVDKVANRVKQIITKDASYRNVTQLRKFR